MLNIIAVLSVLAAIAFLIVLSIIDLRIRLLPDKYVAGLAASGVIFHIATEWSFLSTSNMMVGLIIGGGSLYSIRFVSNLIHDKDTLGLGDVKLMAAGGLWLGGHSILVALTIGALAGIVHGLGLAFWIRKKSGTMPALSTLSLPAGPGFIVGLITSFILMVI